MNDECLWTGTRAARGYVVRNSAGGIGVVFYAFNELCDGIRGLFCNNVCSDHFDVDLSNGYGETSGLFALLQMGGVAGGVGGAGDRAGVSGDVVGEAEDQRVERRAKSEGEDKSIGARLGAFAAFDDE